MKERPILFSGPMVRAILEGRKTQTRRVVKFEFVKTIPVPENSAFREGTEWKSECPFGQPGDRLWVRETWAPHADMPPSAIYRCDRGGDYQDTVTPNFRWRPSIHMPRWASRLTLEITAVRVERLQDISEEDVWEEGCTKPSGYFGCPGQAQSIFRSLWGAVYGHESWDANPWVWVVEFKRMEGGVR